MRNQSIGDVMTDALHTINDELPLTQALHMMHEYHIHHLPVQRAGKLVGILSDRDVQLALTAASAPSELTVGDVMSEDIFAVSPETPLATALAGMAAHRYGSVVVQNHQGRAIGIFTAVDAVRMLSERLCEGTEPRLVAGAGARSEDL